MNLFNYIIAEHGSLDDLFYILQANDITLAGALADANPVVAPLTFPTTVRRAENTAQPKETTKMVTVQAYQSILDVCVQFYGSLDYLPLLLEDNALTIDSYLMVGAKLNIRKDNIGNKVANTLLALNATISNYDRLVRQDKDIYLGTEDGKYIGPTTHTKMKVN